MKKILSLILALALILGLAACGKAEIAEGSPEAAVKVLMDGLRDNNADVVKSVVVPGAAGAEFELDEVYTCIIKWLKEWSASLEYEIKSAKISGDAAEVPVKVSYLDAAGVMDTALEDYTSKLYAVLLANEDASEEELLDLFAECFDAAAENQKLQTIKETVTVKLQKVDGNWMASELGDDIIDIFFCNMLDEIEPED